MTWLIPVVLIVGGAFACFAAFGGAMTDGAEPSWVGPVMWVGLASVATGVLFGGYLLLNWGLNFRQR